MQLPCAELAETKVAFAGNRSLSTTPVAGGPTTARLLTTRIMYVRSTPTPTGSGRSFMRTSRSGAETTSVLCVARLLVGSGSGSAAVTSALLLIVPSLVGLTTIKTDMCVPTGKLPILQVTTPRVSEQVPSPVVAEMKVTLGGRLSLSVTPLARTGPLLVTPIV